jgi:hypothetical protein
MHFDVVPVDLGPYFVWIVLGVLALTVLVAWLLHRSRRNSKP